MIAQTLSFLLLISAAIADSETTTWWPLADVDPNSLSCDPLGQEHLLLPHFTDCDKFYTCDNGVEKLFNCSAPLIFDFAKQTCNWAWAANCTLRTAAEEDIEGSGDDSEITILTEELDISPLTARLFNGILNCNRADDASRQVAYKGDCQRYWHCASGVPITAYCSDGLFFNENTQQCDHEANVKCNVEIADELQNEFMLYD